MLLPTTGLSLANIASTIIYSFSTSDMFGKAVVIILIGGSIFAWSIMIAKTREFARAQRDCRRFLAAYRREAHPLALFLEGRRYEGPLYAIYSQACDAVLADAGARSHSPDLFRGTQSAGAQIQLTPFEINTARKIAERSAMDLAALLEEDMGLLATAVTAAPVSASPAVKAPLLSHRVKGSNIFSRRIRNGARNCGVAGAAAAGGA